MKRGNKNGSAGTSGPSQGRAGVLEIPEMPGKYDAMAPSMEVLWMLMVSGAYSLRKAVSLDRLADALGYPDVGRVLDLIRELRTPLFTAIWRFVTEPGAGYTAVVWLETGEDEIREFADGMAAEAELYRAIAAEMAKQSVARLQQREEERAKVAYSMGRATGQRLAADGVRDAMRANYRGWIDDQRRFREAEAPQAR